MLRKTNIYNQLVKFLIIFSEYFILLVYYYLNQNQLLNKENHKIMKNCNIRPFPCNLNFLIIFYINILLQYKIKPEHQRVRKFCTIDKFSRRYVIFMNLDLFCKMKVMPWCRSHIFCYCIFTCQRLDTDWIKYFCILYLFIQCRLIS